jgi:hypothetical protein
MVFCKYDRVDNDAELRILFPVSMRYAVLCITSRM